LESGRPRGDGLWARGQWLAAATRSPLRDERQGPDLGLLRFMAGKLAEARRALAEATSDGTSGATPESLTRAQWGAASTRGTMSANPAVREVALHHTAFLTAKIAGGRTLAAESAHIVDVLGQEAELRRQLSGEP